MSDLDTQALEQIREWAKKQVDAFERQQRMAPLREAMLRQALETTNIVTEIMAGPTAQARESLLSLEQGIEAFPAKMLEAEKEIRRPLVSARLRTAALRRWLEELS